MKLRVGLDIGGTKTAALVVDEAGRRLGEAVRPTDVRDPGCLVAGTVETVDRALAAAGATRADLMAAGVGIPGQVDPAGGLVRLAVNLNLLRPYPLGEALRAALGVPVTLENDVRAAAWGAYHWVAANVTEFASSDAGGGGWQVTGGKWQSESASSDAGLVAARLEPVSEDADSVSGPSTSAHGSLSSLAYLSIGTGISAGLVLDGRLYRGAHGMAGEIGHIPLDPAGPRCACGSYGCLEAVAAGPAIAAQAAASVPAGERPLSTGEVYALAAAAPHTPGQAEAERIVARAAGHLSRALYLLVMAYDVERVVLGGGVTRAGSAFERPLRAALATLRADSPLAASMLPDEKVVIVPPDFNAGVMGAVFLAA